MRALRKRHPLIFDATLLATFVAVSFLAYTLTSEAGSNGAIAGVAGLAILCLLLVISR